MVFLAGVNALLVVVLLFRRKKETIEAFILLTIIDKKPYLALGGDGGIRMHSVFLCEGWENGIKVSTSVCTGSCTRRRAVRT